MLDALDASHGLSDATDIVLTGESAGGIGVWPSLDALAARYTRARIVGAPIGGFYACAPMNPRAAASPPLRAHPLQGPVPTPGRLLSLHGPGPHSVHARGLPGGGVAAPRGAVELVRRRELCGGAGSRAVHAE